LGAFAVGETGARLNLGELLLESVSLKQRVAQFDLTLAMAESEDMLVASLEYNTDIFDEATVTRMARHFCVLLESIVAGPEQGITELRLLDKDERRRMLVEFNAGP